MMWGWMFLLSIIISHSNSELTSKFKLCNGYINAIWFRVTGPWGVPFLGYLPFMKSSPHAMYSRMADKYGEISSIKLGNHLVVCLNSPKLVKELFSRSDSIARPRTPLNEIMEGRGNFSDHLFSSKINFVLKLSCIFSLSL